jgi:phospholipase/carboxylesterase
MVSKAIQNFQYEVIENDSPNTLFLFHGTGGTEKDLIPFVSPFHKTHTIVSLLGNVREHGMARFFERSPEGVLDQESIQRESHKIVEFVSAWCDKAKTKVENATFIGYSNGANIILAMLFRHPELIKKAALLHPMLPFEPRPTLDLSQHKLFMSWGNNDQMILPELGQQVAQTLKTHNAQLTVVETSSGHHITKEEVLKLHEFILR